jgi:putative ABC transport system permease protein
METFRFAARLLRRSPAFTVATIAILATGIGANTAMFSIVSGVLLKPFGFARPEDLVVVGETRPNAPDTRVAVPTFLAWSERQSAVKVAAYSQSEPILAGDVPTIVMLASVTSNFFDLLGESVLLGRPFVPDDDRTGAARTVILSHGFWLRRFAGDSSVLGRSVRLGDMDFQVIGVARPGFELPEDVELWTALMPHLPEFYRTPAVIAHKMLIVLGRLGPGVTIERATGELSAIARSIQGNDGWTARVVPLRDALLGSVQPALLILMGAVMLVLLIACANVGNLLLARGASRQQEIAIRAALGASRGRILKELVAESLLLALTAGVLGVLLATWVLDALIGLTPTRLPRMATIGIDVRVLAFASIISLLTGLIAGVFPALRSAAPDLTPALKKSPRGTAALDRGDRLRGSLVIAEVALSVVLLASAGLLLRSFVAILSVNPGFQPEHVTAFDIALPRHKYGPGAAVALWDVPGQLVQRTVRIPGVSAAATTADLPISGRNEAEPVVIEGQPLDPAKPHARRSAVSPGYFQAMGIPLQAGRGFRDLETTGVVIVNERFVRVFFPDGNALGKNVRFALGGRDVKQIVGVVGDVHHTGLTSLPEPVLYAPAGHSTAPTFTLVVRSSTPAERLVPAVRMVVRELDPDAPITRVATMREIISRSVAQPRFYAVLLASFATLAVLLAMLGLYSVLAQSVVQRRQEIGIRMALGAAAHDILGLLLGQGLRLTLVGAGIGLIGALMASRLLSGLLFGIQPNDPATLAGTIVLLGIAAFLAIVIPARRAARLDPMRSLRH